MESPVAGSKLMDVHAAARYSMVRKILLVCGILSALIWMGSDIFASVLYEGYNYPLDPISGLSTPESPVKSFLIPVFNLYLVLKISFAVGVWMTAGQRRSMRITAGLLFASGLVDLVVNFFPWDPGASLVTLTNIIHGVLAGGLTGLLFLVIIAFGARADGRWFRYYSYGTLIVIFTAGGVIGLSGSQPLDGSLPPTWIGLTERIIAYGLMLWMLTLAFVLLRVTPGSTSLTEREYKPGSEAVSAGNEIRQE